jgi:predicted RNA binding protein YcfA (HicA-like mRNA interferase family)
MRRRVRRLTVSEVERILCDYGFELVSQHGSHRKWRHAEQRLQVIVPYNKGKALPAGTLQEYLHQRAHSG